MALTSDQDNELTKNLMGQFGAPQIAPPSFNTPSSFDVNTQGPNLDSTYKMSGAMNGQPAPIPAATLPPPTPQAPVAPPVDTAIAPPKPDATTDDDEETKNKKVVSSHPGFDQDALDKYLAEQKGQMDKYGPDAENKRNQDTLAQANSLGQRANIAGHDFGDAVMMASGNGNPGTAAREREAVQHAVDNSNAMGKNLNEANMASIKAKEGLDKQSSSNPLGASAAAAMIPMLKQIYPGKTDAQYAEMAHNPAVAEALLPEGVKLADAKARLEESKSNREFTHQMQRESMDYRKSHDYDTRLEKDTGALMKDPNVVKAQGTLDKLGTAKQLLEAGMVNNASAKQALQTALTFVATGGQRVNETEMRQLGGAHTVTNRINQWMQGLDRGTLTPKDYQDMKQVIGIYENAAHHSLSDAQSRFANIRSQREHIDPKQALTELGGQAQPTVPHPQDDAAVLWAQQHPQDPRALRILKANGR